MPTLAMSAGTVTAVWGAAFIRLPNGVMQPIHVGDKLKGGEHILTEDNGIVQISPVKGPSVVVQAAPANDVDKAIAALDAQDPDQAPAAGLAGGGAGGFLPGLRVDRVAEGVSPLAFEFETARPPVGTAIASTVDQRVLAEPASTTAPTTPVTLSQASINDVTVNEAAGTAVFTVTLDKASSSVVTITYTTNSGTATSGSDFTPVTGTITFQPGQTTQTIAVPIKNDDVYEGTESFTVTLGNPNNVVIADGTGVGTIKDDGTGSVPDGVSPSDDRPYMLVYGEAGGTEGGQVGFTINLTHASTTAVTVSLALKSGTDQLPGESATAGVDTSTQLEYLDANGQWQPVTGNLTFEPGQTQIQVRVAAVDDHLIESTEYIKLEATVVSGETVNQTSANHSAITDNDAPIVMTPIETHVSALDTNLMIVLDTSASMSSASGIDGLTRLQAAVKAIYELLDKYDQYGDVAVRLVTFSNSSQTLGDTWLTVAQAKALLLTVQPDGNTNYDYALTAAETAFATATGKLSNAQNVSYFLSDGNPTLSSAEPNAGTHGQSGNLTQPSKGDGIDATEEASWVQFLDDNHIKSYAIGMGTEVSETYLNPIAHDGQASSNINGTVVTDFGQLSSVLSSTTQNVADGNLSTSGSIAAIGAGGFDHVSGVTIDGVTYAYDAASPSVTVHTTLGGDFTVNMQTGEYSYSVPHGVTDVVTQSVSFSLVDQYGNPATNTLSIIVDHTTVTAGTSAGDVLTGQSSANLIMGSEGGDTIAGGNSADILYGNGGDDVISGGAGADVIVGGKGNDVLTGGDGSDTFVWRLSDSDTTAGGATLVVDTIKDFDAVHSVSVGGDVLNLKDLLQGEHGTSSDIGNLQNYLVFDTSGADTVIKISTTGEFTSGMASGTETQHIVLEGVNVRADLGLALDASNAQVIAQLLAQNKLVVDHA
jgi:Mg-chelatase subunit ChlD